MNAARQPIQLTVTGTDAAGEEISLSTQGDLFDFAPDEWSLEYHETNPDDMQAIHTLVQCDGTRITVTRTGTLLSTLVFDEHDTFVGDYPTPFGSFQIRVYASKVHIRKRGSMGHIHLVYQVNLTSALSPNEETSLRCLDIRFTPRRQ